MNDNVKISEKEPVEYKPDIRFVEDGNRGVIFDANQVVEVEVITEDD